MAVEPAIARDTAERAGVRSTALAFQRGDDLHHAHLRTAGNRAARKNRAQGLARADIIAQATAHIRDDVVHMRIAFERHQPVDRDGSWYADADEIVAFPVEQPYVQIGRAAVRE